MIGTAFGARQREVYSPFSRKDRVDQERLRKLLSDVARGKVRPADALTSLRDLPFVDMGFARYDTHRALRRGFPEVILAEGKTEAQVVGIVRKILAHRTPILITRARPSLYLAVVESAPRAEYHEEARAITVAGREKKAPREGLIVVAAGTSDIPVAEEAAVTAEIMGNRAERIYDVGVAGIHRLLAETQRLRQARVIIVAAGMEGALPGVVTGMVEAPVIGVPVSTGYGTAFGGVAALLSMLNACASGLTVVNIDNGFGAGYAASLILAGYEGGKAARARSGRRRA
jgi:NCAIR mutase (PurE)-related protein